MSHDPVMTQREGAVGVLRFNRTDKLNALDMTMVQAIDTAFGALQNYATPLMHEMYGLPLATAATARKSSIRPLVQEPMKTRSIGTSTSFMPGVRPI